MLVTLTAYWNAGASSARRGKAVAGEDAVVDAVVDLLVVHQTLKKKFLLPIENRLRRKLKLQLNCKQCNVENI